MSETRIFDCRCSIAKFIWLIPQSSKSSFAFFFGKVFRSHRCLFAFVPLITIFSSFQLWKWNSRFFSFILLLWFWKDVCYTYIQLTIVYTSPYTSYIHYIHSMYIDCNSILSMTTARWSQLALLKWKRWKRQKNCNLTRVVTKIINYIAYRSVDILRNTEIPWKRLQRMYIFLWRRKQMKIAYNTNSHTYYIKSIQITVRLNSFPESRIKTKKRKSFRVFVVKRVYPYHSTERKRLKHKTNKTKKIKLKISNDLYCESLFWEVIRQTRWMDSENNHI